MVYLKDRLCFDCVEVKQADIACDADAAHVAEPDDVGLLIHTERVYPVVHVVFIKGQTDTVSQVVAGQ